MPCFRRYQTPAEWKESKLPKGQDCRRTPSSHHPSRCLQKLRRSSPQTRCCYAVWYPYSWKSRKNPDLKRVSHPLICSGAVEGDLCYTPATSMEVDNCHLEDYCPLMSSTKRSKRRFSTSMLVAGSVTVSTITALLYRTPVSSWMPRGQSE